MRILTRYLLRAHIGPFLFAFAALTGIITINMMARRLADLAGKGLATDVVLEFFVLSLPATVALTFPMAVLVSILYTFSNLASDNELTALKASGIDLKRLLLPVIVVAAMIAGGMVWFNDRVLPEANHRWSQLIMDIGRKSPLFAVQEQMLNRIPTADGRAFYLRASRIDATTNRMRDVVIYDVSQPRVSRTVYADSGVMAFNEKRTDLLLTLFDGHLREVSMDRPDEFQRLDFARQMRRIPGVANEFQTDGTSSGAWRGDREMTVAMMEARIDTLRKSLREAQEEAYRAARADVDRVAGVPAKADTTRDVPYGVSIPAVDDAIAARQVHDNLGNALSRVKDVEQQIREYEVEIQKKFSIAAATLVFVLVGAPLAIRFPRGGVGMVIAASLVIFAIYYVGLIGGETLADEGYVSPGWAMWVVNALMVVLGTWGVARMGGELSTARGGVWEERLYRLRERFSGLRVGRKG
ncbi:MAG: LptF/LptG family permease [Gemmatimonadota bacterium]|nr:LptF/LptG family permease [Gemmatimonadota bacterium]